MTNERAAQHIQSILEDMGWTGEHISTDEREALEKAVTALQHQPEPQKVNPSPVMVQCEQCGKEMLKVTLVRCINCGSTDLRPIYTTSEVKL